MYSHIVRCNSTGNLAKLPSADLGEVRDFIVEYRFGRQGKYKKW